MIGDIDGELQLYKKILEVLVAYSNFGKQSLIHTQYQLNQSKPIMNPMLKRASVCILAHACKFCSHFHSCNLFFGWLVFAQSIGITVLPSRLRHPFLLGGNNHSTPSLTSPLTAKSCKSIHLQHMQQRK